MDETNIVSTSNKNSNLRESEQKTIISPTLVTSMNSKDLDVANFNHEVSS